MDVFEPLGKEHMEINERTKGHIKVGDALRHL